MNARDVVAAVVLFALVCVGCYLLGRRDGIADALRMLRGRGRS